MPKLMDLIAEHNTNVEVERQASVSRRDVLAAAKLDRVRDVLLLRMREFVDLKFTADQVRVTSEPRPIGSISSLPNVRVWVETEGFYFSLVSDTGSNMQDHVPFGPDNYRVLHVGVACPNGHMDWYVSIIDSKHLQKPTREKVASSLAWAAQVRDHYAKSCERCQAEGNQKTAEQKFCQVVEHAPRSALAQVLTEVLHGSSPEKLDEWTSYLTRVIRES